jgi:hypothetical protein
MRKHSVTNRMVSTFAIILSSKTLGFCKMLIVLRLENPEGVMTFRTKEEEPRLQPRWLYYQDFGLAYPVEVTSHATRPGGFRPGLPFHMTHRFRRNHAAVE